MMLLVQGEGQSMEIARRELPMFEVGQLISPLAHHQSWEGEFAIDNGAFNGFDREKFGAMLKSEWENRDLCLFVVVPDVVGSARRTLEVFRHWYPRLHGWPLALVAQDGQEDLDIPWHLLSCVFIGGTTAWKLSNEAEAIIRAAQAIGVWVHVGRVNTSQRIEKFLELGVDSIDGASLCRHGGGYRRDRTKIRATLSHPKLFQQANGEVSR